MHVAINLSDANSPRIELIPTINPELGRSRRRYAGAPLQSNQPKTKVWQMTSNTALIAVFEDHQNVEAAVKKLADSGMNMQHLSVVGKGITPTKKSWGSTTRRDGITSRDSQPRAGLPTCWPRCPVHVILVNAGLLGAAMYALEQAPY